ncbi:DUF695 domain-containing protein [Janthinobacterium agaricidamnosum]|uniref:DUF695 domain-containing protein n=1 Tax=Janthinobacterium agaricidamnosum NBRC 102515 = DSM 9628 TaxID=1349767 RepID=W0V6B0_9BURK|nr:DUF695 domain-containing protein [Janthinobacterium agaricidamnosum]CDG84364.1 hypothetical protein GJA_3749 [Janthinobacterium agaricidamnosum NBRC 102515 = DSM 9628]
MNLSSTSAKSWATVVTHSDAQAIIYRFVDAFHPDWDLSTQPDRIILAWKYQAENGMPSPAERERMEALEEILEPVVEEEGFATLALVSTGENLREWVYYTASGEEFFNRLNQALAIHPRFPIEIHSAPDPAWTTYERLRASVVK